MLVKDFMIKKLVYVFLDIIVVEVVDLLREYYLRCLLVVEND